MITTGQYNAGIKKEFPVYIKISVAPWIRCNAFIVLSVEYYVTYCLRLVDIALGALSAVPDTGLTQTLPVPR